MAWTLARIRSKIRELTGKPSTSQLSDAEILLRVNDFYINILPSEVDCKPLRGWYDFSTVDGTGTQVLPASAIAVEGPVFLEGDEINFWTDDKLFYSMYPFSYVEEQQPNDLLIDGRTLYIRPIPDAEYDIKIRAYLQPGTAFSTDASTPSDDQWGPLIAYGAAIDILQDDGDKGGADDLVPLYNFHKSNISAKNIRQTPIDRRSAPRF